MVRLSRTIHALLLLGTIVAGIRQVHGAEQRNDGEPSAEQFLAEVRQPFQRQAWARLKGRVTHIGDEGRQRTELVLAIIFDDESMEAKILLGGKNVYGIKQEHKAGMLPRIDLHIPDQEVAPTLMDLGVGPADVTFAFIYWDLQRELPPETVTRQACRVMELKHPGEETTVRVWFSKRYYFPLKAAWFHPGQDEPWRMLEFKSFRQNDNGLWYMQTINLRGSDWKTQVRFQDASIALTSEQPVPDDLLDLGHDVDAALRPR